MKAAVAKPIFIGWVWIPQPITTTNCLIAATMYGDVLMLTMFRICSKMWAVRFHPSTHGNIERYKHWYNKPYCSITRLQSLILSGWHVHKICNRWQSEWPETFHSGMGTGWWKTVQMFQHSRRRGFVCRLSGSWSNEIVGFIVRRKIRCSEGWWVILELKRLFVAGSPTVYQYHGRINKLTQWMPKIVLTFLLTWFTPHKRNVGTQCVGFR